MEEPEREDVLDAFCGAGCASVGFEQYFNVTDAIDIKPEAAKTYQQNHRETRVRCQDIRNLTNCRNDFQGVTGVFGGPPCQQWSRRNVHRKESDDRADLPAEFVRLLEEIEPRFFMMENVPTAPKEEKFKVIRATEALGYTVVSMHLNAADFGAAQTRRRWIVVGQKGSSWRGAVTRPPITVRQAFATVPHIWGSMKCSDSVVENMRRATPDAWTSSSGGKGYKNMIKLEMDKPAPTVVDLKHVYMVHPEEPRNISLAEGAVLQGFPPNYKWSGTESQIARMIANAMPRQLAGAIAESLTFGGWPQSFPGVA